MMMTFNTDQEIIEHALAVMEKQPVFNADAETINSCSAAKQYFTLKIGTLDHEQFTAVFLDNQHRYIHYEALSRGSVSESHVHPRELARMALKLNASAVLLGHNHPSGIMTPSRHDRQLTDRIVEVLHLIDVRVIDHIIVSADVKDAFSFCESGLLM